jgi:DNA-binding FadR family transcriptional regulator
LLDADVLEWAFESEPDVVLFNSLFELRNIIEVAAAGLAAKRRSAHHLKAMRSALERMARCTLATEEGRQADIEFHSELFDASNNPFIISLTSGVSAAIRTTTMFKQRHSPLRRDPVPDHARVFAAIEAGDCAKATEAGLVAQSSFLGNNYARFDDVTVSHMSIGSRVAVEIMDRGKPKEIYIPRGLIEVE